MASDKPARVDPLTLLEARPIPAWVQKHQENKAKKIKQNQRPPLSVESKSELDHNNVRRSWQSAATQRGSGASTQLQPAGARKYPHEARAPPPPRTRRRRRPRHS